MKLDVDSIIYIVITIAIIVLSGLGSARKRQARNLKAPAGGNRAAPPQAPGMDARDAQQGMDPFERLERMFAGEMAYGDAGEGRAAPAYEEKETEEEETGEEEEVAAEEIQAGKLPEEGDSIMDSGKKKEPEFDYSIRPVRDTGEEENGLSVGELFRDVADIRKAVIYSEIFNRRYT